jgi:hypothetical protein
MHMCKMGGSIMIMYIMGAVVTGGTSFSNDRYSAYPVMV